MDIKTRKVTVDDLAVLSALARQTFYDTFTGTCTEEDMQSFLQQYFNESALKAEIEAPGDRTFFALVNDQPVAYLRFMEDYSSFTLMKEWKALELKRLYILSAFQGKGIAQVLMDYFLNYAALHTYEVVWLGVWEHNYRAQKFYLKYGFADSGHRHDFPIGNTPQTDIWMWKYL
jgi:ribosomal protein S18 acetylase RimI-like enzyme